MGLLGGSSKSSSKQTISVYDSRTVATDDGVVNRGSGATATNGSIALWGANGQINLLDGGAIDLAGDAIASHEKIILDVLSGASGIASGALQSIADNADKAFQFIDKNLQDSQSRTANTLIPWVIAGVSAVAIAHAMRK